MFSARGKLILLFIIQLGMACSALAQNKQNEEEVVESGLQILKNYFLKNNNWHVVQPEVGNNVNGLINFLEDQPIDNIIEDLNNTQLTSPNYVQRLPENVEDSLSVPGFVSSEMLQDQIVQVITSYHQEVKMEDIPVPPSLLTEAQSEVPVVPEGKGIVLFSDSVYTMPDSLIIPEVIPDSVLNTPEQFNRLVKIDSIRNTFIEQKRLAYNDSIMSAHVNFVVNEYRQKRFDDGLAFRIKRHKDSVKLNNYNTLKEYNDRVVAQVNDSIQAVIEVLSAYADFVDTTRISIINLTGQSSDILLQNGKERFSRLYLKNAQNDSLRIMVKNNDKRSIQMLIDDGVTISRFKQKETKDFDFESLKKNYNKFSKVGKSYDVETPWRIGGDGSVGLTQTYLENWKKGGKSALSSLLVLKGFANYSRKDGKVKWENSGEIRNGWIRPGGAESELQKNDDKFEITSRFGVSAFKKWYYSTEFNFNTQFFRGYKYPKANNPEPFSAFLAPATTYLKVGLDYKPKKDLSVFISPLTLKNVYVRDTSLVEQTRYGIDEDRKAFWEPGLNADIKWKKNLTEDITYETKYKMFINYKDPFSKFDVNWENLFKMRLTDYINMQFMAHFIYDDNILFPVYDADGNKVGEESKLQIKELFTIGFTYKINKKVMRTHRIR